MLSSRCFLWRLDKLTRLPRTLRNDLASSTISLARGILNLASGVVCLLCRWRGGSGLKVLCSPIVLPRSNRAGLQKGVLGPLS